MKLITSKINTHTKKKVKKRKMPLVFCSNIKAQIEDFTNVYIAAND